ncbi:MAG: sensor histidine kinase [Acidimicrobiales bacterium]
MKKALAVAVAGTLVTTVVSIAVGMSAGDSLMLAAWAVAAAGAAGLLGAAVLAATRTRTIATQVVVVAVTAVAAVGAATLVAAAGMYVSDHDLHVLAVVLLAGGTAGVVVALVLGERVAASSRSLRLAVQGIAAQAPPGAPGETAAEELAALARELDVMSARLEEARASEQALEESRRELVAWVSHDLRTPLAAIRAMTEALEDGVVDSPETVERYHRTIRQEADRLSELVDDLFELSRIHAGALRLQMERASLVDIVSDAIAAAGPVASAKGVRLEGRLREEPPELLLSTPEFSRVLRNLIENAIRHTPSDGTVFVEAGADGEAAYVSVADGCGGIRPEHLDRVFEVAFRGEDARTPGQDNGAGLGLAIAKGLVDAHAGEIVVANEGDGCRFTVRLPLAPGA